MLVGVSTWYSQPSQGLLDATRQFLDRVAVQPSPARQDLYNETFKRLDMANVVECDAIWVKAAHDLQTATLNLVSGNFTLVPVNSPTFVVDGGIQTDGATSYLKTGFVPSGSTKYQNLSAHMGIWCNIAGGAGGGKTDIGANDEVSSGFIRSLNSSNNATYRMNHNIASSLNGITTELGHTVIVRSGLSGTGATSGYKNGAAIGGDPTAALGAPTVEFYIGAQNSNGVVVNIANRRYAAGHVGAGLTAAKVATLNAILANHLSAMGAQ